MIPVAFHPDAEKEAIESAEWYERLRVGLGSDFRFEMARVLERIAVQPMIYAEEEGVRFAPMSRFPYSLIYQLLDKGIGIVAVAHNSRNPKHWRKRIM